MGLVMAWRKRQAAKLGTINEAVFAANRYRPAIRHFVLAARREPGILVDADLPDGATVLDVGAYEGAWAKRFLQRCDDRGFRDVRVHAFEPVPGALDLMRANLDDDRVVLHPFGLAGRDRVVSMAVAGPGSTEFGAELKSGQMGSADGELRDAASVFDELGLETVDFAKINIEGGEYELIDRLHETGWLPRIRTVLVQFHDFAPHARRRRRRNRRQLAESHACTWNYPWVFERWDRR